MSIRSFFLFSQLIHPELKRLLASLSSISLSFTISCRLLSLFLLAFTDFSCSRTKGTGCYWKGTQVSPEFPGY